LRKKILDEKYLIERQFKQNAAKFYKIGRDDSQNSSDRLRVEIATELKSASIQSILTKIRRKQTGRRKLSQTRNVRILENVTIPEDQVTIEHGVLSTDEVFEFIGPVDSTLTDDNGMDVGTGIYTPEPDSILPGIPCDPTEGEFSQFEEIHIGQIDNKNFLCEINGSNINNPLEFQEPVPMYSGNASSSSSTKKRTKKLSKLKLPKKDPSKKCDECGKVLASYQNWENHVMTVHHRQHRFKCNQCGYGTHAASLMRLHMVSHTDQSPFKCVHCNQSFKLKHNLTSHVIRNHTKFNSTAETETTEQNKSEDADGSKITTKCEECGILFSSLQKMRDHVSSVHKKQFKYNCSICNFGGQYISDIDNHMMIHTDEKKFKCDVCQHAFKYKRNYTKHMMEKHKHRQEL